MSNTRDIDVDIDADLVRPLDARSLALSALLGTHPPVLPARALVALAELFGIAGGTMRTALSRLAAGGDVVAEDGRYRLSGRLLERQHAQDLGRRIPDRAWDGRWHTVIAAEDRRRLVERRRFRASMVEHRFGELRPDIWMRPANLAAPASPDALVVSGPLTGDDQALVARLWDLDRLAARADRLLDALEPLEALDDDDRSIPTRFETAAAVLRFLRSDPLLPADLVPAAWPVDRLRTRYATVEDDLQRRLRAFFRFATPGRA